MTPPQNSNYRTSVLLLGIAVLLVNVGLYTSSSTNFSPSAYWVVGALTGATLLVFYLSWQKLTKS